MPYTLLCLCGDHVDSSSISLENVKIGKKEKKKKREKGKKESIELNLKKEKEEDERGYPFF